jgi:membrane protease YdiL (CAAX protease family)
MKTITSFIRMHPLLTYCALTFAISWGGMLIVVGPGGFPTAGEQSERLLLFAYPAMLAGPSVAGILLTALLDGRAGLREFGSRLLRWRVGAGWYAVALLTAPLLMTAVLLALSLTSPDFVPRIFSAEDKVFLLLFSIITGLLVGVCEELGWTGFAVPTLLRLRYGVLSTGLIVGLLFAAWNSLVVFWVSGATGTAGALPMAIFLPAALFTWLPTYRVLMVWVYDHTRSLLVAMLMHTSLAAFWTSLTPLTLSGMTLVTFYLVITAALWVVIAAVAVVNGWRLSRQSLRRRVA